MGLAGRGNDKFGTYSLGMKQRLGIAYALRGNPDLVCLDEPTNGLDPASMIEVRELIHSLGDSGHTVLLSSHLLHAVEQVCDSVTIISKGKLVAQGEVAALVRSARGEQVRVKTTDDAKAREILSAVHVGRPNWTVDSTVFEMWMGGPVRLPRTAPLRDYQETARTASTRSHIDADQSDDSSSDCPS